MQKLRAIRTERTVFEPRFYEKHPDLWPIARAARTFADCEDWPEVERYVEAFRTLPNVAFEVSHATKPRRRRVVAPVDRDRLYDAVIVGRGVVPTRPRMWHDYLNALVWATFPRAKLALHRRQHAAIQRWIPPGATQLPNARTRELDALALVDEGGILMLGGRRIFFGHALFEGLVLDQPAMIARVVMLGSAEGAEDPLALLDLADGRLAETLDDAARITSPEDLARPPI